MLKLNSYKKDLKPDSTRTHGFTILELVIFILVLGILVTIFIPKFKDMVERGRAAEGVRMLGIILRAEKNYLAAYSIFTSKTEELGIELPETDKSYFNYSIYTGSPVYPTFTAYAYRTKKGGGNTTNYILVTYDAQQNKTWWYASPASWCPKWENPRFPVTPI